MAPLGTQGGGRADVCSWTVRSRAGSASAPQQDSRQPQSGGWEEQVGVGCHRQGPGC